MSKFSSRSRPLVWLAALALGLGLAACGTDRDYTAQPAADPYEAVASLPAPQAVVIDEFTRPSAPDPVDAIREMPPAPAREDPYTEPPAPDPVDSIDADWFD